MSLHSTMFLFQCSFLLSMYASISLYIPLCFYFNKVTVFPPSVSPQLYIPLCFYFNVDCRGNGHIRPKHFTFHYVSISICIRPSVRKRFHPLHSTMFLFQFSLTTLLQITQQSLHSTMFLFQYFWIYFPSPTLKHFTFHYVSISILQAD